MSSQMQVILLILTTLRLDPAIYASKRATLGYSETSRLSIASSDGSVDLQRTRSTSSNNSSSTTASSVASGSPKRAQHRRAFSGSSIHVPRRFQKKLQKAPPQEAQQHQAPVPTPVPIVTSSPTRTSDWQCSDLVVRCKNDVYHVDRVIMCYHSRWFAKVCAVLMSPVSVSNI